MIRFLPAVVIMALLAPSAMASLGPQGDEGAAKSAPNSIEEPTALVRSEDLVPDLSDPNGRRPIAVTPWFSLHSDIGFNIYDAVLTSASARLRERPDPVAQGECWDALVQEERSAWNAAVDYFAATVAATSDFSRERTIIRTHMVGIEIRLDDDDRRDLALSLLFLRAAAPAWRDCHWEKQDAANRRWVAELVPRLERHGNAVGARLQELFGKSWNQKPLTVDVVKTSGWAGADTIAFQNVPTHIQISSRHSGYQGAAALEMIFHEASHELVSPHRGPMAELLAEAAKEVDAPVHRSLWHGVLFVTVGEVVRQILADAEEGPYTPFADGVFGGDWKVMRQPLVEQWLPYVRGEVESRQGALDLMTALKAAMAEESP